MRTSSTKPRRRLRALNPASVSSFRSAARRAPLRRAVVRDQSIDFRIGDPMMAALVSVVRTRP